MSIFEKITALIERIRELTTTGEDSIEDINVLKSELLALIPELDDIRTRVNDDLETDQNRIVELERDVEERDNKIDELRLSNADLVSKMGKLYSNNIDTIEKMTQSTNDEINFNEFIKKFD